MWTTKELLTGYGEEKRNALIRKLVMRTCGLKIWEDLQLSTSEDILVEVEQVKAHRTNKGTKEMSNLRSLSLVAMRKRMTWQRQEQCWTKDSWRKRQQRQSSKREKKCTQPCGYAASFHWLVEEWKDCEELTLKPKAKWNYVDQKSVETKHRTEWRAEADKYRCMRCGRGT